MGGLIILLSKEDNNATHKWVKCHNDVLLSRYVLVFNINVLLSRFVLAFNDSLLGGGFQAQMLLTENTYMELSPDTRATC